MILATLLMVKANAWQSISDASVTDTSISDTSINNMSVTDTSIADAPVIDLGTYGETFPVAEANLLEVIRAKLQALFDAGKMESHQQAILNRAREQMNRPAPVRGVTKTVTPRSFSYDPSLVVPDDLKDSQGKVFCHRGTKVNPLDTHQLAHPLLFVDGDDAEQVFWAIKVHKAADPAHKPKIILVQGAPLDLSQKLRLPVYFDQHGQLVRKLGIAHVPAYVSQAGKALLVEEVSAEEVNIGDKKW